MKSKRLKNAAESGCHWQEGSIGDLLSVGICILAMVVLMMTFLDCVGSVGKKTAVSQLARRYILHMETAGYLSGAQELRLRQELQEQGVTDIELTGTTMQEVTYGQRVELHIKGKIGGKYPFEEVRVSTAKN